MKLVTTTYLLPTFLLISLTLAQNDYQDDYLGGKEEEEDDYVFLPGKNNNNKPQKDSSEAGLEGSGSDIFQAGNEEVIDNDDEDYSDYDNKKFAGNSDDSGSGIGAESDDETIYDDLDENAKKEGGVGIFKPELKATTKDKPQFSEPGEDEDQPFEIEPYNPNASDDFENDDVFKPSIPESPDTPEDTSENTKNPQNPTPKTPKDSEDKTPNKSSIIPLPAWIDDFWGERWFVAALLGGAIVGFLIIVIVIIFICHAVRKKDEGSYIIDKDYKQGVDQTLRLGDQTNGSPKVGGNGAGGEYFA